MPRLAEDEEENLLRTSERTVRRWFDGFLEFALQGNILEIAFGLM